MSPDECGNEGQSGKAGPLFFACKSFPKSMDQSRSVSRIDGFGALFAKEAPQALAVTSRKR
jgi:hypothetical protein